MVIDHLTRGMARLEALHAIQENPDTDTDESDLNLEGAANIGSVRSIPGLDIGSDKANRPRSGPLGSLTEWVIGQYRSPQPPSPSPANSAPNTRNTVKTPTHEHDPTPQGKGETDSTALDMALAPPIPALRDQRLQEDSRAQLKSCNFGFLPASLNDSHLSCASKTNAGSSSSGSSK